MRCRLPTVLAALVWLLLVPPGSLYGANYHLESRTLLQLFKRDSAEKENVTVAPIYEYLRVEASDRKYPGLSLHLYGWGRTDLGDGRYFDDRTEAELLHAYLEYRRPDRGFDLKAGRFHVFEGVANDSVDGLSIRLLTTADWTASLYGGLPVSLAEDDGRRGDWILGGRVARKWGARGYFGISYKGLGSQGDRDQERAGIDLALRLPGDLTLLGASVRNLRTDAWGEHFYELRLDLGPFQLRPFYQYYDYRGRLSEGANSSSPFRFLATLDNAVAIVGTEGYWFPGEQLEAGLKVKRYEYDMRFDDAVYLAGLMTWKWRIFNQVGGEIGRMDGDGDRNRYLLGRGFAYLQLSQSFLTGDVMYVRYDRPIFGEDRSLSISLGGGRRFWDDRLRLKLSATYSSDPVFESDRRYTLVAEYFSF